MAPRTPLVLGNRLHKVHAPQSPENHNRKSTIAEIANQPEMLLNEGGCVFTQTHASTNPVVSIFVRNQKIGTRNRERIPVVRVRATLLFGVRSLGPFIWQLIARSGGHDQITGENGLYAHGSLTLSGRDRGGRAGNDRARVLPPAPRSRRHAPSRRPRVPTGSSYGGCQTRARVSR